MARPLSRVQRPTTLHARNCQRALSQARILARVADGAVMYSRGLRGRSSPANPVGLEVRPTSRFSAHVAVGRTSCDRLGLGTRPPEFIASRLSAESLGACAVTLE